MLVVYIYILLSVIAIFSVWFLLLWRNVKKYWKERGVAYSPPHLILVSLTFLQKENPVEFIGRGLCPPVDCNGLMMFNNSLIFTNAYTMKSRMAKRSLETRTSAALSELKYPDCVIKEILRIFPPMGWLDRIASQDYIIDDNLTIKAGTPVFINGVAMQVDPQYFPDPEVFKPDRFLPENEKNIVPYTYFPFGEGLRGCIGMRFAYQTIRHSVALILLNFELKTIPDSPKPTDCRLEKNGMLLMPDQKLSIQFVPRQNSLL